MCVRLAPIESNGHRGEERSPREHAQEAKVRRGQWGCPNEGVQRDTRMIALEFYELAAIDLRDLSEGETSTDDQRPAPWIRSTRDRSRQHQSSGNSGAQSCTVVCTPALNSRVSVVRLSMLKCLVWPRVEGVAVRRCAVSLGCGV